MTSLMTSGSIGSVELKNRIIMAPMGTHMEDIDRATVEYFMRRADGGAAMLMVNLMVTDYFEDTSSSLVLTEKKTYVCSRSSAREATKQAPGYAHS